MKAEIIAVGTEILLGEIIDTNSAHIAQQLPELGIDLFYKSVVGDNRGRLQETFARAWNRSDIIFVTGGLGPTEDDMTREGIAEVLGETPAVDPKLEETLRGFFARRNYPMPESNLKQAWLLPSARAIDNPRGTAPGWWVERDGHIMICMPGVPSEMERMWRKEVRPQLEAMSTGEVLITRTIKTVGIGEGTVDEMAKPLYEMPGVGIGTYARADGVQLRIGAKGASPEEAWALIYPVEDEMEKIFGSAIWGKDDDTLEGMVGELLKKRGQSLAALEGCTGGLFASIFTENDDSIDAFAGGLVASTVDSLIKAGVPDYLINENGLVSTETAEVMATVAREKVGADYGIGITGHLGPDPDGDIAPGTMHIGIATPLGHREVMTSIMNQGPAMTKRRAVTSALVLLRGTIMGEELP